MGFKHVLALMPSVFKLPRDLQKQFNTGLTFDVSPRARAQPR